MTTKERTIYDSDACNYDFEQARKEYAECTEVELDKVTDEEVWQHIYDKLEVWYKAEQDNLNKTLEGRVIALVEISTWRGSEHSYKVLSDNLNSILYSFGCDNIRVYSDKHGVHSISYQLNGINCVDFRELREDRNVDLFLDKIENETVTDNDIEYYTRSLESHIKKIYG